MVPTFRFLQVLALGAWVGSILFFSFVVAPGAFSVLPNQDLAGSVVNYSLRQLHMIGIVAGVVYLLAAIVLDRSVSALARPAPLLVFVMILCTIASQYVVISHMELLRQQMGSVAATPASSPLRVTFDRLHQYSVWLEGTVLLAGLIALFLTARQQSS